MRTLTRCAAIVIALVLIAGCEKTIKDVRSNPSSDSVALAN